MKPTEIITQNKKIVFHIIIPLALPDTQSTFIDYDAVHNIVLYLCPEDREVGPFWRIDASAHFVGTILAFDKIRVDKDRRDAKGRIISYEEFAKRCNITTEMLIDKILEVGLS